MNILTVNTGSSSVRLALFVKSGMELKQKAVCCYGVNEDTPERLLRKFLMDDTRQVNLVSHRVVHGGTRFTDPCVINDEVEEEIGRLSLLAPLHNPLALKWIRACRAVIGNGAQQIAVFDTAFYARLPQIARLYALPKDLCVKHG
ncbi:MAG TPA: acetate/propionate family kinase, partial [Nitrospirae bacterium]|nr:acetate/propionate family kinase [Nitrospirota bacterium]